VKLGDDAQPTHAIQICKPVKDQVIVEVVRQSRQERARECSVPFLSFTLVRKSSGNIAWRLIEAVITERSVGILWQNGSPKRLRLGLILVLRQVASKLGLAESSQRSLNWKGITLRCE
jgi:hypothetical protein